MEKLFGTDGIRGRANTPPMTVDFALRTGQAAGFMAREQGQDLVVIGKDTRISGEMLEAALAAGVASAGVHAGLAGVIPTPGVAFLAAHNDRVGAGIVISASHNPYYDNGIKLFAKGGVKLTDDQEAALESKIRHPDTAPQHDVGKILRMPDSRSLYAAFLKDRFVCPEGRPPVKVVVDAANGAASDICREVFVPPGFDLFVIHDHPDGYNINQGCGSQHTADLSRVVVDRGADLGIAFDGDADRMIAVDETGKAVTGDRILAICARHAKQTNRLNNNVVVSTVMSNIGLTRALSALDITHVTTGVGDRRVLAEMNRTGASMGGEDSGHMIFFPDHTTGDGLLSALRLISVMVDTGQPLSELAKVMTVYPQVLKNVAVDASRPDVSQIPAIADAIDKAQTRLSDQGRVLVRYSGTQPLLRVMVEGPDPAETTALCDMICRVIQTHFSSAAITP